MLNKKRNDSQTNHGRSPVSRRWRALAPWTFCQWRLPRRIRAFSLASCSPCRGYNPCQEKNAAVPAIHVRPRSVVAPAIRAKPRRVVAVAIPAKQKRRSNDGGRQTPPALQIMRSTPRAARTTNSPRCCSPQGKVQCVTMRMPSTNKRIRW